MRDGVGMEGRRQGKGCDGEAKKREGGQTCGHIRTEEEGGIKEWIPQR